MTEPRLTPAETANLDKKARRWTQAGGLIGIAAVALFLAAIWADDSRYAATGGIVLGVGLVAALLGGVLNTPSHRKSLAERLRDREADRG